MIDPLAVATEGWLTSEPLPIASSGYLYLVSSIVDVDLGGGGTGKKKKLSWEHSALGRRILREDEEILAIIMVASRTMQ